MNFKTVEASPVFRVLSVAVIFMACIPAGFAASLYDIGTDANESIPSKWTTGIDAVYDDGIMWQVPVSVTVQWATSDPHYAAAWLKSIIGSERDVALAGFVLISLQIDLEYLREMADGLPDLPERDFVRREAWLSGGDRGRRLSGDDLASGWTEGSEYRVGSDFDVDVLPVVPEPSGFLLGLFGAGMAIVSRRRSC
jgi:hypothetical protein